jgi:hypothetical protein
MSKSRHTEAQIIGALKEAEGDVALELGMSKHTLCAGEVRWHGRGLAAGGEAVA